MVADDFYHCCIPIAPVFTIFFMIAGAARPICIIIRRGEEQDV